MADGILSTPALIDEVDTRVHKQVEDAVTYAETYDALESAARTLGGSHTEFFAPDAAPAIDAGTAFLGDEPMAEARSLPKTELPIAVLVDAGTGSSGEAVAVGFIGQRGVRLFGDGTVGFASANEQRELEDGAVINLTTALDVDRTGRVYDGPIIPDGRLVADPEATVQAAVTWLQR